MIYNYLITVLRKFFRYPLYSIINVSGLVLGLTCSIFIFLWVLDELSFNNYHPDNSRVFKVMKNKASSDRDIVTDQWTTGILAETLKAEIPEVEETCRIRWSDTKLFRAGNKANYEYGDYADKSIFRVLNIKLIAGNPDNALTDDRSVAISRKMAEHYFNSTNIAGNTIRINNTTDLTITAVFENVAENATEAFDFILPMEMYAKEENIGSSNWNTDEWIITLVLLKEKGMAHQAGEKIKDIIKKHSKDTQTGLFLFPMEKWRLYNHFENGKQSGGRISYVIALCLVAVFILLIACINFMNLSTARAANRVKEVGIRKVAGASRKALIGQFIAESISLSFFSLIIALLLVHLLLPLFNDFTNKKLIIDYFNPVISGSLILVTLLTGFLAGSYPAFFLSSFRPALVLKGVLRTDFKGASLRKILVVFQFCISMIIIVCALVVNDQITFLRHKDLGFDRKNVVMVRSNPQLYGGYNAFRNELLQDPVITSIALGAANPMEINGSESFEWKGKSAVDNIPFNLASCDYDYVTTLGFTIVAGRSFSRDFPADSSNYLITETAAGLIGFANPIGQHLRTGAFEGQIVGVIKDFHNLGIHENFQPAVLALGRRNADFGQWATAFVRYEPGKTTEALDKIRSVYKKHMPDFPIQFSFLDDDFEYQFRTELIIATLASCFTVMAVIISCLGLFGLALFSTERRVKEISIRKVLGASLGGLVVLLCRDFVRLIVYAIIIGIPLAYYLMENFLKDYAYHTELTLWMFVVPAGVMLVISLSIIVYQSTKAALNNPVDAMRSE